MNSAGIRKQRTATGRLEVVVGGACEREEFAERAAAVAQHFELTLTEKVNGFETLLLLARSGNDEFCLSWDVWLQELSVMAYGSTPDAALERLVDPLTIEGL